MASAAPEENPVDLTGESNPLEEALDPLPLSLTVSSWNISSSQSSAGVSCQADPSWTRKDNENCIARAIIESFSDILILQEAPESLKKMLSKNVWRMEHAGELLRSNSHCPYLWVLVKKRLPCEIVSVKRMDGAILVLMRFNGGRMVEVAGVHFMAGAEAFEMRKMQMEKVIEAHSKGARLVVAGDMNVRQREVAALIRCGKADLAELQLPKGVFTWNGFKNKYHGPDAFAFRCNFDRVFVSCGSGEDAGGGDGTSLFGNKPIVHGNSKFYLSDHFGIRSTVRLA